MFRYNDIIEETKEVSFNDFEGARMVNPFRAKPYQRMLEFNYSPAFHM